MTATRSSVLARARFTQGRATLLATVPIDHTWIVKSLSIVNWDAAAQQVGVYINLATGGPSCFLFNGSIGTNAFQLLSMWVVAEATDGVFVNHNLGILDVWLMGADLPS